MNDLNQSICLKCGEVHNDKGKGIMYYLDNPCNSNHATYHIMGGRKMMEVLNKIFINGFKSETDILTDLISFEYFPHLKPIDPFLYHPLDEQLFTQAREYEVISLLRLRRWIEIEEEFSYKY